MTKNNSWCRDVTESEQADYRRDGVVLLKAIYPASWVDTANSASSFTAIHCFTKGLGREPKHPSIKTNLTFS